MSNSNYSQAHDFYYKGVDLGRESQCRRYNISYDGPVAYSYSTVVARVIPAKGYTAADLSTCNSDRGITLLSMDSMSSTTGRHISLLYGASPFRRVRVPMEYGARHLEPRDLAENIYKGLSDCRNELSVKAWRDRFLDLMEARRIIIKQACKEWAAPLRDRRFSKFDRLDVAEAAEKLKAARRKAAAREQAETRALLAKYVKGRDGAAYCTLMRVLFDYSFESPQYPFTPEQRSRIRAKFAHGDASFVWPVPETDEIVTSRHVHVSLPEARVLLKAWAAGKDMRTMPVGRYTIVKYTGDTIQIGCHKIPRANMLALYEAVVGTPFPKKLGKAEPDAAPETEVE